MYKFVAFLDSKLGIHQVYYKHIFRISAPKTVQK
jgi:hypothetical protein